MSAFILMTITGLGLGALYFLVASGLSLIYGLMGVLNFAHGAFLTISAYLAWSLTSHLLSGRAPGLRFGAAVVVGLVAGGLVGALVERLLIRPLYERHVEQVLVTVGVALAVLALVRAIWGADGQVFPVPRWAAGTTRLGRTAVPNDRWLVIGVAVLVLVALLAFLRHTRHGLVIRAGVENRAMVRALGIDVERSFTLVFALGGAAAGLAGVLAAMYFRSLDTTQGESLLIFAFIAVVVGGLGSLVGSALAAVVVGVLQQYVNYYASSGIGDMAVVLLLAAVLLTRPQGLAGRTA